MENITKAIPGIVIMVILISSKFFFVLIATLGSLMGSVLATGPMGLAAADSGLAENGGFLWVIKICSSHFLQRRSKAVGPSVVDLQHVKQPYRA
jgi:hypothetical protein